MQIILDNLDELFQLVAVLRPEAYARAEIKAGQLPDFRLTKEQLDRSYPGDESPPLPQIDEPAAEFPNGEPAPEGAYPETVGADPGLEVGATSHGPAPTEQADPQTTEVDATGRPWDEAIDSGSKKLTAKGVWAARKHLPEGFRDQKLAEWEANQLQKDTDAVLASAEDKDASDEPVATETHALPKNEPKAAASAPAGTAAIHDMLASDVVTAAAQDASDSHADLIKACQGFITEHGHAAFNVLKAAVAPLEGSPNGAALPNFTPGQRRTMQAAIANYALFV